MIKFAERIEKTSLPVLIPVLMIPTTITTILTYVLLSNFGFNDSDVNMFTALSTYVVSLVIVIYILFSDIWKYETNKTVAIKGFIASSLWIIILIMDYKVMNNQISYESFEPKISIFRGTIYGVWCGLIIMWMVSIKNVIRSR